MSLTTEPTAGTTIQLTTTNLHDTQLSYSRYHVVARNERQGLSPQLSAWAAQLRRNISQRWPADLTEPVIEPQTSCTDSYVLNTSNCATRLTTSLVVNDRKFHHASWRYLLVRLTYFGHMEKKLAVSTHTIASFYFIVYKTILEKQIRIINGLA